MFTGPIEAPSVDVGRPLTGGDAVQPKMVGALPPEQEAVRVTFPGDGNDDGDGVIVQPDGGSTGAAATVTVVEPSEGPLGVGPRNE